MTAPQPSRAKFIRSAIQTGLKPLAERWGSFSRTRFGSVIARAAALLLAWRHAPDDFAPQPPPEDRLEGMSKADLITLIQRMLKADPDLEDLLDLPLPGSSTKPLDETQFQRQVTKAINGGWLPMRAGSRE